MGKGVSLLTGAGLGAGLMYVLDPASGNRRRRMAAQKVAALARSAGQRLGKVTRHLGNRCRGLAATTRRAVRREAVSDDVLVARVAARLGRCVSHPRALGITAEDGQVTLIGPILATEVDDALRAVRRTPGVRGIDNLLDVHETGEGVPSLRGGSPQPALAH